MTLSYQARRNWKGIRNEEIAQEISAYAQKHLSHLFTLTPYEVNKALLALSGLCEARGKEVDKEVGARRLEWEEACCGFRFEMWCM